MASFFDRVFVLAIPPEMDVMSELGKAGPPSTTFVRLYPLLACRLNGKTSVQEIIASLEGQASADEAHDLLEHLIHRGWLEEIFHPASEPGVGAYRTAVPLRRDDSTATMPSPLSGAPLSAATPTAMSTGREAADISFRFEPDRILRPARAPSSEPSLGAGVPSPAIAGALPADIPSHLGPYRILRRIGAGGMGVVYEALDEERSLRVALKTLPRLDPARLVDFKAEFRIATTIAHTNLANPYELMFADGTWFFTMPVIHGVDFIKCVHAGDWQPPSGSGLGADVEARLRSALQQLTEGVMALHGFGLLHLDLKPGNVLVEPGGRVVILDFGLSRRFKLGAGSASKRAPLQGTPAYIAPEQVLGQPPSRATDWYSIGVMLFEALTGALPFRGSSISEILRARVVGPAPRAASLSPGIPRDLDELCALLLQGDPELRPQGEDVLRRVGTSPGVTSVSSARSPTAIIGRRSQLDALVKSFWAARAGAPLFVHVKGLSGIGKSMLAEHFLETMKLRHDALILSGRCYEWESLPYKGFDAVVDELCRHVQTLPDSTQDSLLGADGHDAALLFPGLRSLHALDRLPRASAKSLDPPEQRRQSFRAIKYILGRLCRLAPVVLFIDDLQWGDVDSARLLVEILSPPDPPPLLVLGSYRQDEAEHSPFLCEMKALRGLDDLGFEQTEVEIGPLAHEDAVQLATALLGQNADPARAEEISREAAGSPFFIEEFVRHALGAGAAASTAGPVTLDQVVKARLSRLPEEARRVLQIVAVAGRLPEQDLAIEAAHVRQDPHEVLSLLRGTSLIRTRGPRRTDAVEIYHDRIRERVVALLEPGEICSLHRDIASTLEGREGIEPDVLAYHFHGARELARAASYAILAAERAHASLAFDRAASLYRSALAWGGAAGSPQAPMVPLAHALFNAGRCAEAASVYLDASETASGQARRELRGLAAKAYLAGSHVAEGIAIVKPLLKELGITYPSSPARSLLSMLGQLARLEVRGVEFVSRPESALPPESLFPIDLCWSLGTGLGAVQVIVGFDFHLRSLLGALRVGEPRRVGRALAFLGASFAIMGGRMAARGEAHLDRAEALGRRFDDIYLQGIALLFRALAELSGNGRCKLVTEQVERALQILGEQCTGVSWERDMATSIALKALEPKGEILDLGRRAASWMRDAAERGGLYAQMVASYPVALYNLASGDVGGARRQIRSNLDEWSRNGYTVQHYYAVRLEAFCDLYEGRVKDARARLEGAWQDIRRAHLLQISMARVEILSQRATIELTLAVGRRWGRSRLLRSCRDIARTLARERRVDGPPHADLIRAGIAAIERDRGLALTLLDRSSEGFDRAGMDLSAWCARRRKGEIEGDATLVRQANAWMVERGIRDPERWTRLYTPEIAAAL